MVACAGVGRDHFLTAAVQWLALPVQVQNLLISLPYGIGPRFYGNSNRTNYNAVKQIDIMAG